MLAMYRFAAALPFTSFARRPRRARFVVPTRRELLFARATFFFERRRRRCVVAPPLRPARWNMAWVAAVCCANPAKPPGGTIKLGIGAPI
jgi:hypothetical protein